MGQTTASWNHEAGQMRQQAVSNTLKSSLLLLGLYSLSAAVGYLLLGGFGLLLAASFVVVVQERSSVHESFGLVWALIK
jgi:enoyl-CoA hydratase/carnithine racemase